MFKKYIRILMLFSVALIIQFFVNDVQANIDGAFCRGSQGYVYEKATDYSCTVRGLPGDPNCPYTGLYYPGSPYACSAGQVVVGHHFTMICPTCTPPPPPCSPTWRAWSGCSLTACDGGTRTRTQTCTGATQTQTCSINGACGAVYDDAGLVQETDTILDVSSAGLCADGSVDNFSGSGTDADPYTWTCVGTGSCNDATCDAKLVKGTIGAGCTDGVYAGFSYTGSPLSWPAGFEFCTPASANAVPDPNPVPVPDLNMTTDGFSATNPGQGTQSWTCSTANGSDGSTCTASIDPPSVQCGTANNETETNTEPSSNLCGDTNNIVSPQVVLGTDGRWTWGCQHNIFTEINSSTCSTPSCIANNPVNVTSPIMLSNNMTSAVSVTCSSANLCCNVTNNSDTITVCNGETGEIPIVGGLNTITSQCWFDSNNDGVNNGDEGNTNNDGVNNGDEVLVNGNTNIVQTMCTAKACNAQGTCQSTPQIGTVLSDCTSTCNSNADCSSGRLIETMP